MGHLIEASCRCASCKIAANCCARPEAALPHRDQRRNNNTTSTNKTMKLAMSSTVVDGVESAQTHPHHHGRHIKLRLMLVAAISIVLTATTILLQVPRCNAQESRSIEFESNRQKKSSELIHEIVPAMDRSDSSSSSSGSGELFSESRSVVTTLLEDDDQEPLSLSTRLPRQHFRLIVGPTPRTSSPFRLINIRRRAASQKHNPNRRNLKASRKRATKTGNPNESIESSLLQDDSPQSATTYTIKVSTSEGEIVDTNNQAKKPLQKGTTKKISSAALKKLLINTLPRLNGTNNQAASSAQSTSDTLNKGPNFKFVFIQRAPSHSNATQNASNQQPAQQQQKPSLAASISRQLGNSLLYTATTLINHHTNFTGTPLTSGGSASAAANLIPSLSALAAFAGGSNRAASSPAGHQSSAENELVSSSTTSQQSFVTSPPRNVANEDASSNQIDKDEATNNSLDIRRLSRPTSTATSNNNNNNNHNHQQQMTKTKPKKSRPSKIYNLPVKFVSNGQPNSVMFKTIKQHFTTIKKLQQQAGGPSKLTGLINESGKARKKLPGKMANGEGGQTRLKGTNSRLIYLPLKYLSNAKPSMLSSVMSSGTKASHKSAPSSSSSSSSSSVSKSNRLN